MESSHAGIEDALRPSVPPFRAFTGAVIADTAHRAGQHILRILRANPNRHPRTTPNSAGHAAYPLTWANSEYALFTVLGSI